MISSVETLSRSGCRTSSDGGSVAVPASWAAMRPGSRVRARIGPLSRIRSPSRDNDSPYLLVGQRPAGQLRQAQHVLDEPAVHFGDAVGRQPVAHVARARRAVDEHLLRPAEQAGRYARVDAVHDRDVTLLVRLEDRRRVHPGTGLEDVAAHGRVVRWYREAEHTGGVLAVSPER